MKKVLSLLLLLLCLGTQAADKEILNLRTNYEKNPLGIEELPRFSWEMSAPGQYGAAQKAYRLVVAKGKENLEKGIFVYDSGKKESSLSVSIGYEGEPLDPETRYYWQVSVWDEKGKELSSKQEAWFETALMGKNWSGAQWIGSRASTLTKYAGKADIEFDLCIEEGSKETTFYFGYRDEKNYAYFTLDVSDTEKPTIRMGFCHNGQMKQTTEQDIGQILKPGALHDRHHIRLCAIANQTYSSYDLTLEIDQTNVKVPSMEIEKNFNGFNLARLYGIGFQLPQGQRATVANLAIREPFHKTLVWNQPTAKNLKGDGKPHIQVPNEKKGAPMLRKCFELKKKITSARLYATARGIYEMSINGKPVSQDFFNPGWPDFRFRQTYNTFDVTELLKEGKNAIGAVLGKGYYTGPWGYHAKWGNGYGMDLSLLAKLVVRFEDGTQKTIVSDASWQYSDKGPVLENNFQDGEDYDARREMPGWDTPDFQAKGWKQAKVYPAPGAEVKMQAYIGQPVRIDEICKAQKLSEPLPKHFVYDMGQNMVGVPRLKMKGTAGKQIEIKYAEMVYPDLIPTKPVSPYTIEMYEEKKGQLYTDAYRGALSTDHYTFRGAADGETFEPHFTSHGFRYIEITGLDEALPLEQVEVLVLNSLQEKTASFKTDNELVNKLYSNIVWGQKGNFQAVPTDCPQRDERLGWTGDAQIFTRTATYNRNVQPFFNRWLYTLRDDQSEIGGFPRFAPLAPTMVNGYYNNAGCGWGDVGIITPWEIYLQYGDTEILQKSYGSMCRYMDYLESQANDFIQPIGGYGDWVALLGTPSDLTNTAYSALDAQIMEKVARILGKEEDAKKWAERFQNIKSAFCKRFLRENGTLIMPAGSPATRDSYSAAYGTGPKTDKDMEMDTQTGYILPLYANLLDGQDKEKAVEHLVNLLEKNDYHLNTGFIGTPYMCLVLSDNGRDDIAYRMFQQEEYPSWLYPVLQGATTIWERWNSYTKENGFGPVSMNSFNHYSYGAVEDWMMAYAAGIQRDETAPGYKHIILQPRMSPTLGQVEASFCSMYGEIRSAWKAEKKDSYTYEATIPANTTATLVLQKGMTASFSTGSKGILQPLRDGKYELSAGKYKLKIQKRK